MLLIPAGIELRHEPRTDDLRMYASRSTSREPGDRLMHTRHGSRLWHSKGRHRYRWYWHIQAGPHHEGARLGHQSRHSANCAVPHPHCHVRYPRSLRARHIRPHCQRHQASTRDQLLAVCWILPHGCWTVSRAVRAGCGLCDWNCGRRGMLQQLRWRRETDSTRACVPTCHNRGYLSAWF